MTARKRAPRYSKQAALAHFKSSLPEALEHEEAQRNLPIDEWARQHFYIAPGRTIELLPHQVALVRLLGSRDGDRYRFRNQLCSTIKKSGKTTFAAILTRHDAESGPPMREIYLAANDREQAANRVLHAIRQSILLDPQGPNGWEIRERELRAPNGTFIRAIPNDYRGEAGANPSRTVWTELWSIEHEAARRLYEELTPVPTVDSVRLVETSAGYEGQSELLRDLYELGMEGRQLTAGELAALTDTPLMTYVEAPNHDSLVPIWVNEAAGLVMYWDEGLAARRMPWQQGEEGARYYGEQEQTLRPSQFRRLHLNQWSQGEEAFVPIEWWDACVEDIPELDARTPLVLGVDAGLSKSSFAIVGVTPYELPERRVAVRLWCVWDPPEGGKLDFAEPVQALCELVERYHVVEVAYDEYQAHEFMAEIGRRVSVRRREFSQGAARNIADKTLYDVTRDRRLAHCGPPEIRDHLVNANAKLTDDSRLRIVRRSERLRVDLAVALSMAVRECLRLNIWS